MKTVTLDEAKTLFTDTTNNLSSGETYLVEQNGKRFAEITLFESGSQEIHNAVPEFTPLNTPRKPGGVMGRQRVDRG